MHRCIEWNCVSAGQFRSQRFVCSTWYVRRFSMVTRSRFSWCVSGKSSSDIGGFAWRIEYFRKCERCSGQFGSGRMRRNCGNWLCIVCEGVTGGDCELLCQELHHSRCGAWVRSVGCWCFCQPCDGKSSCRTMHLWEQSGDCRRYMWRQH